MGNYIYNKPTPYYAYTYKEYDPILDTYRYKNYYRWKGYDNNEHYEEIDHVSFDVMRSSDYRLVDIVKRAPIYDFNTEIMY